MYRYIKRCFLWRIGSHYNGGWELLHLPAETSKPKNAGCIVPIQTQRPENQWASGVNSQSESKGLRTRRPMMQVVVQGQRHNNEECHCAKAGEDGCPNSSRSEICLPSMFLFYSVPQWIGWCPPALVRTIFFTQYRDSNASLFWKLLHRHTQK